MTATHRRLLAQQFVGQEATVKCRYNTRLDELDCSEVEEADPMARASGGGGFGSRSRCSGSRRNLISCPDLTCPVLTWSDPPLQRELQIRPWLCFPDPGCSDFRFCYCLLEAQMKNGHTKTENQIRFFFKRRTIAHGIRTKAQIVPSWLLYIENDHPHRRIWHSCALPSIPGLSRALQNSLFLTQMNYEGSAHPMSRLREGAKKKGAAMNREPHAKRAENRPNTKCERRATGTSAREDPKRNGSLAWTSEFNAPRTVMLRTMSFVLTPPAVSAPMSKRVRSRSSRPSNRVSASPGERATKPTCESACQRSRATRVELHRERKEAEREELHQETRQNRSAVPETPKATGENARAGKMTRPTKACTEPEA